MEFLPEVWDIIKEYAGVYHIGTEWRHVSLLRYWEIEHIFTHFDVRIPLCGCVVYQNGHQQLLHNLVNMKREVGFQKLMQSLMDSKNVVVWKGLYMLGGMMALHGIRL